MGSALPISTLTSISKTKNMYACESSKSKDIYNYTVCSDNIDERSGMPQHTHFFIMYNEREKIMSLSTLPMQIIKYEEKCYELHDAINLIEFFEDEYCVLRYDDLGIEIYEKTEIEAVNSFCAEFDFLYQNYALSLDTELTVGAIKLKKKILSYVKKVE